jgi:hypothetical protein
MSRVWCGAIQDRPQKTSVFGYLIRRVRVEWPRAELLDSRENASYSPTKRGAREYVWGPGDWGVDELLVQYDAARRATWPILDSGGDVTALCDLGNANISARELRTSKILDTGHTKINGMPRHNMTSVRNRYDRREDILKTLLQVSICA